LTVLYPLLTDADQFERENAEHEKLLRSNAGVHEREKPYRIVNLMPGPGGPPPYHEMFQMEFPDAETMLGALNSRNMQEVATDAQRISTGRDIGMILGSE